jgi:hypothetical protein
MASTRVSLRGQIPSSRIVDAVNSHAKADANRLVMLNDERTSNHQLAAIDERSRTTQLQ